MWLLRHAPLFPALWRLGQHGPLAPSARTHSAEARIQLPEHHHGAFSTHCLSPAFLHRPPNCLPSTHSPARGDTNGVLPNSKPFRGSQGLEDKTPSSLSWPERLPWPCPNLRLPGAHQKASVVATQVAAGPLHTLEAPSLQGPHPPHPSRLLPSSSQTHFTPSLCCQPHAVQTTAPCPARAARQRPNQPVEGEQLPVVPATPPTVPTGPKTQAAGTHCWGPDARPLLCEHGPLLASSPTALTAPGAMLRALGTDDNCTDFGANKEPRSAAVLR